MSDMCVCFNYQNSIKLFTSIFTSTSLAYVNRFLHFMGTSKNWILINFIEKPFFNQFMSVFAMKF